MCVTRPQWVKENNTVVSAHYNQNIACYFQWKSSIINALLWAVGTTWSSNLFPRPCEYILVAWLHYSDVIMSTMASQITDVSIVCSTFCSGADQRKHESSASLAFVRGIHRWPVNSPHKGPVTRKMFKYDDVIMGNRCLAVVQCQLKKPAKLSSTECDGHYNNVIYADQIYM